MKKNKKSIHIENSYSIWSRSEIIMLVTDECVEKYSSPFAESVLNRFWSDIFVEWWLHNIGYYVTLWMRRWSFMSKINDRCRCVDLEEH